MAEIRVEPKGNRRGGSLNTALIIGIVAIIAIAILAYFLVRNNDEHNTTAATTQEQRTDTAQGVTGTTQYDATGAYAARGGDWNGLNWNDATRAEYNEIQDNNIDVRETEYFVIYSLDENRPFNRNSNALSPDAKNRLRQVSNSINNRHRNAEVRIYAPANGDNRLFNVRTAQDNGQSQQGQLADQRAQVVRDWLAQNGNISDANLSLQNMSDMQQHQQQGTDARQQQRAQTQHGQAQLEGTGNNERDPNRIDIVVRKS